MTLSPEQIRDMNWEQLQAHVQGLRQSALALCARFGPGTTREIAAAGGWDVLSLRPRVTELVQLGLLRLVGKRGGEGIYGAVPIGEVRARMEREAADRARPMEQAQLSLGA